MRYKLILALLLATLGVQAQYSDTQIRATQAFVGDNINKYQSDTLLVGDRWVGGVQDANTQFQAVNKGQYDVLDSRVDALTDAVQGISPASGTIRNDGFIDIPLVETILTWNVIAPSSDTLSLVFDEVNDIITILDDSVRYDVLATIALSAPSNQLRNVTITTRDTLDNTIITQRVIEFEGRGVGVAVTIPANVILEERPAYGFQIFIEVDGLNTDLEYYEALISKQAAGAGEAQQLLLSDNTWVGINTYNQTIETTTDGNSENWFDAYQYSLTGHVPLDGSLSMTGALETPSVNASTDQGYQIDNATALSFFDDDRLEVGRSLGFNGVGLWDGGLQVANTTSTGMSTLSDGNSSEWKESYDKTRSFSDSNVDLPIPPNFSGFSSYRNSTAQTGQPLSGQPGVGFVLNRFSGYDSNNIVNQFWSRQEGTGVWFFMRSGVGNGVDGYNWDNWKRLLTENDIINSPNWDEAYNTTQEKGVQNVAFPERGSFTTDIDFDAEVIKYQTLTSNTTFTFSNLEINRTITIELTGDFEITWPSYCTFAGEYDGSVTNLIQLLCVNNVTNKVYVSITQFEPNLPIANDDITKPVQIVTLPFYLE